MHTPSRLILGWKHTDCSTTSPLYHEGDGHLVTVGSTGSGKGVSAIIPALLTWNGPAIVIDPKAEAYHVTAAYRRSLGQRVCLLDPFGVVDGGSDSMNPLLLISTKNSLRVDDAAMLAHLLTDGNRTTRDPYWDDRATALITGLILALLEDCLRRPGEARPAFSLSTIRSIICELPSFTQKTSEGLPVSAIGRYIELLSRSTNLEIAAACAILQITHRTLSGIISTAASHMSFLRSGPVATSIATSSISLADISAGKPLTLYIVVPPDKLISHNRLLRLWLSVIITTIVRRTEIPSPATLMLIDEAAQLGNLPQLITAKTLTRGYGLKVWSFWQDLSQLQTCYPNEWPTILNNCSTQQFFAPASPYARRQLNDYLCGSAPKPLAQLSAHESILTNYGKPPVLARRVNYLTDPLYHGRFTTNPFYRNRSLTPKVHATNIVPFPRAALLRDDTQDFSR